MTFQCSVLTAGILLNLLKSLVLLLLMVLTSAALIPHKIKKLSVQKFIKNYKAMFNAEPDNFSIHGYDAAMIVIEAIKRAGTTDGVKVAAEMAKTKDLQVATGKSYL